MAGRRAAAISLIVGVVVAAICVVFVGRELAQSWDEARAAIEDARPLWLAAGVALAVTGMLVVAMAWRRVLGLVGVEAEVPRVVGWYFVGEIGKYVPGGLWPIVGRGELAVRGGVDRSAAYSSVALSLGMLYLANLFGVVTLLPWALAAEDDASTSALWVLALLPFGVAALHHGVLEWARTTVQRLARREITVLVPRWGQSLGTMALYLPAWACIGTATWCLARAVDPSAPFAPVAFAACLSWVVGFVIIPVPGGVGVREATFIAACGLSPGVAAVVAVLARLCFVLVDTLGAAIGTLALRPRTPAPAP
jgi:uncharacterized membrane protein YbhN (UPF0104 family)